MRALAPPRALVRRSLSKVTVASKYLKSIGKLEPVYLCAMRVRLHLCGANRSRARADWCACACQLFAVMRALCHDFGARALPPPPPSQLAGRPAKWRKSTNGNDFPPARRWPKHFSRLVISLLVPPTLLGQPASRRASSSAGGTMLTSNLDWSLWARVERAGGGSGGGGAGKPRGS